MAEEPEQAAGLEAHHHPHGHRVVRIHIDQTPHESPNPTSGEALYVLGKVPAGYELYREVQGDREDEPIHNNGEHVHLKEDEHFHSVGETPEGIQAHRERSAKALGGRRNLLRSGGRPGLRDASDGAGHDFRRDLSQGAWAHTRRHVVCRPVGQRQERDDLRCHAN